MLDSKKLEELANKLFSALPESLQNIETEIQKKFKDILQLAFSKMDLVTREEFDVQTKVLSRTREKVEALESQLQTILDKQLKGNKSAEN